LKPEDLYIYARSKLNPMKNALSIFAVAFLMSCTSPSSEEFNLKNMQSKNPEISTFQNGTGFEQQVLQVKPSENQNQSDFPAGTLGRTRNPGPPKTDRNHHQKPLKNVRSGQRPGATI